MALDLPTIVRRLQEVEARHPEVADELAPMIAALVSEASNGRHEATVSLEEARRILGEPSGSMIEFWLATGVLKGTRDADSGEWEIPLSEVVELRDWQEGISAIGGDELTQEELDILSETRIGTFPWQRGKRQG